MKKIKFDLLLGDAVIKSIDDLREHATFEVLELCQSGRLQKWLRVRGAEDLAVQLDPLHSNFLHDQLTDMLRVSDVMRKMSFSWSQDGDEDVEEENDGEEKNQPSRAALGVLKIIEVLGIQSPNALLRIAEGLDRKSISDDATVRRLIKEAAEKNCAEAQWRMSRMLYAGDGVKEDREQARIWLEKAAARGHARAEYQMASHYLDGVGVAVDKEKALQLLRSSASQGYVDASIQMGKIMVEGRVGKEKLVEGIALLEKAANQGEEDAQRYLGTMYAEGSFASKDLFKAEYWLEKLAYTADCAYEHRKLALDFFMGIKLPKNSRKGIFWMEKAATGGDREAVAFLRAMYSDGIEVTCSTEKAAQWREKAEDKAESDFELAKLYGEGVNIRQDFSKAARWCLSAAEGGCFLAQKKMAYIYEKGLGMPANKERAGYWLNKFNEACESHFVIGFGVVSDIFSRWK